MKWISVQDRLPDFVKVENKGECLIPTNYTVNPNKYISIKRKGFCKLHRLVFYINNSEGLNPKNWIEKNKGKVIMHSCDNPNCINPDHLNIGTQIDNIRDRVKKGRSAYHENNGNNKLKQKDVDFIRYYYKKRTIRELSEFFNVNISTIHRVVNQKSWQPLPEPPK